MVFDCRLGAGASVRRAILVVLMAAGMQAQSAQNPSPMVEPIRAHARVAQETVPGERIQLSMGQLYLPPKPPKHDATAPLLVFFHAPSWLVESAAREKGMAAISASLGAGSGTYEKPFLDAGQFAALLDEAESKAKLKFGAVTLGGWSAGGGAVRQIIKDEASFARVGRVIIIDGIHASYVEGKPGPLESRIETVKLESIVRFAKEAEAGKKRMLITHSEIFPGTFASTTETAHYIAGQLGLVETPVMCWGPGGLQGLSEARRGGFTMVGYAGNSAPDHVDELHALRFFLADKPLTKRCAKP
jgi:hypothetical protein